jgi:hypothetical protein
VAPHLWPEGTPYYSRRVTKGLFLATKQPRRADFARKMIYREVSLERNPRLLLKGNRECGQRVV